MKEINYPFIILLIGTILSLGIIYVDKYIPKEKIKTVPPVHNSLTEKIYNIKSGSITLFKKDSNIIVLMYDIDSLNKKYTTTEIFKIK